jgi:hypothetical protein
MKAHTIVLLVAAAASTPAFADPDPNDSLVVRGERGICTRVQLRGASRIAYQRICRTPTEWRERLGPDWRQVLAGHSPEDGLDTVDLQNRDSLESTVPFGQRDFGRPGGGTTGPLPGGSRGPR